MYGSSLKLFYKKPIGHDRINGEYRSYSQLKSYDIYQSEWGSNPEQSRLIREFMFGVGEVISGVFCVAVSGGAFGALGVGVTIDGSRRMFSSLNSIWAQHQAAMMALQNWEQTALKPTIQ